MVEYADGKDHKVVDIPALVPVEKLSEAADALQEWFASMRRGKFSRLADADHIKTMDEAFALLDADGSGTLDPDEVGDLLEMLGENPLRAEEVDALILAADVDGDGCVDLEEFRALTRDVFVTLEGDTLEDVARICGSSVDMLIQANPRYGSPVAAVWRGGRSLPAGMALRVRVVPVAEEIDRGAMLIQSWWSSMRKGVLVPNDRNRLMRAFAALDTDGSGGVDSNELHDVLGLLGDSPLEEEEIDALLKAGDANGDGVIDVGEFLALVDSGYVCLPSDTLRGVAVVCNCNPKLLAQHNGIPYAALDDRLPSGFIVRISESSRRVVGFDAAPTASAGVPARQTKAPVRMSSPVHALRAASSPPGARVNVVTSIDASARLVHEWWAAMRLGQRWRAPADLAESLAPLDELGQGNLDQENLHDVVTLLGDDPLDEDAADALVEVVFKGRSSGGALNRRTVPISALVGLMSQSAAFVAMKGDSLEGVAYVCDCDVGQLARGNGHGAGPLTAAILSAPLPAGTVLTLPSPDPGLSSQGAASLRHAANGPVHLASMRPR